MDTTFMNATAPGRIETRELDNIFKPKRVVIVGASPEVGTARNSIVRVLLQTGFPGTIYLVSPRHMEIEGLKCYPDVTQLPEKPDLALIITPNTTVTGIVEQCGTVGIPAAVVFSSGFEEMEGGKSLAEDVRRAADRHGIAVLGTNCQGAWSVGAKAILTFGAAARRLSDVKHAPIAVISQSGALGGAIAAYLQNNEIGCAYMVSVGNETQLDVLDVLAWSIEQDDVRVAVLYVEGFRDGSRLLEITEKARQRGVQIVVMKAGNTELGQSATASHTGKIASPFSIYSHVLDQAGVIAVDSLTDLLAIIQALNDLPAPRVTGDAKGGVSVLSTSGGACAMLADNAERFGVPMAEFSPNSVAALEKIFPAFGRPQNPADMTGQIRSTPTMLDDSLAVLADDPRTEAFVMQFASSGRRDVEEKGHLFRKVARDRRLPLIVSYSGEEPTPNERKSFRQDGVVFSRDPAETMRVLGWIYQRQRYAGIKPVVRRAPLAPRSAPRGWSGIMGLIADCGIDTPAWRILKVGETAASVCDGLQYPVVVKALPEDAEHKTELGLVKLRVASPGDVDAHAETFRKTLGKPNAGILVQEMVQDSVEVVLACLRKTDFGPILTIGLGGIGIELFRDVAHLALPVDEHQVRVALQKLKLWTLLQGYRGKPATDIDALTTAAVRFGDAFLAMPDVSELEINPLLVMPKGQGVTAVDALVS